MPAGMSAGSRLCAEFDFVRFHGHLPAPLKKGCKNSPLVRNGKEFGILEENVLGRYLGLGPYLAPWPFLSKL
jgi:hypothetical protein